MIKITKNKVIFLSIFIVFLTIAILPKKETAVSDNSNYIVNPHEISHKDFIRVGIEKTSYPLNPFYDNSSEISIISTLISPSLVKKDRNNDIILDIAKEYWYEDNGETISVVLNENFTFGNSKKPLTTKSVLNTYKVLANPNYGGKYSYFAENLKGYYKYKSGITKEFEGIEILGDYFIKFHFNNVNFSNINSIMFPISDVKDSDLTDNNIKSLKDKIFTNGAGKYFVRYYDDNEISLELKDKISKDIDRLDFYTVNSFEAINKYNNGSIDILYKYNKDKNFDLNSTDRTSQYTYSIDHESSIYKFLGFNRSSSIFDKKEYRTALRNSLDIEKIVNNKNEKGVYSFPHIPIYKNSWFNNEYLTFQKGKTLSELLDKEYRKEKDFFIDSNGRVLEIKLIVQKDNKFFESIKDEFKNSILKQGIKLNISYLSSKEMFNALRGDLDFDIFISQRHMTELPRSYNEEKYDVEERYTLTSEIENLFPYLQSKIKENVLDSEIQYMAKEWKKSFIENTPYIVLATENKTTIINNKIKGIYLNEFIGLDNLENLKNIHFSD